MAAVKPVEKTIKGKMNLQAADAIMAQFAMDRNDMVRSNVKVVFGRSVLPDDYEPEKYDIEGSFEFKVIIKKK